MNKQKLEEMLKVLKSVKNKNEQDLRMGLIIDLIEILLEEKNN